VYLLQSKTFRIKGEYRAKKKRIPFMKEVRALKEADAIEIILSQLGSKHRVKRKFIKIIEIKPIQPDEITDPIIKDTAELLRL